MTDTPHMPVVALSVRQPWAWAIIHGGKDVENRSWQAPRHFDRIPRSIAIHAALGMTQDEYEDAASFMEKIGVDCPPPNDLLRGGIVGQARLTAIVDEWDSPWFFGPRGLVLADAKPVDFIGCTGALGFFKWEPNDSPPATPKRWMLPKGEMNLRTGGLFND